MKTKTLSGLFGIAGATILATVCAFPANANDIKANDEECYSGTITAVDAKDNTVKVRGYFFNKNFVLANDCKLAAGEKNNASLADFRPGERVDVHYKDASGVLVADRMNEQQMRFTGVVQGIDVNQHTLIVHRRGMDRTFALADNCRVLGNGNSKEALDSVRWGDQVTVVYELPGNRMVAREIVLPGKVFTGSLDKIDLSDRTLTADKDHRFYLANDCVIISNGKSNGRINDLQAGRSYELNYQTVGGINVVDRIAPAEQGTRATETPRTAQYLPPE